MNDLFYEGKLKKKHNCKEIIGYIEEFALKHNLTYNKTETSIDVDFQVEGTSVGFHFDGVILKQNIVQHNIDADEKYLLIYKLLYDIRKFFNTLDITDDFAIWADYSHMQEPETIELRELTKDEEELLSYIDFNGCTNSSQVVFALIDLFIWDKGNFVETKLGIWDEMIKKIPENQRIPFLWINGIIDVWVKNCMVYKEKPIDENVFQAKQFQEDLSVVQFSLMENLIGLGGGAVNKKQVALRKFFVHENELHKKKYGRSIDKSGKGILRVIFTTLEYMGFKINISPTEPPYKIPTKEFDYYKIV